MWLGSETQWPLKRLQVLEIERDCEVGDEDEDEEENVLRERKEEKK